MATQASVAPDASARDSAQPRPPSSLPPTDRRRRRPGRAAHWRGANRGVRWYPWVYGLALALWAASWNLRLSVLMSWMPVEPVLLSSLAVGACVAHRCGQRFSVPPAAIAPLALLVISFLPGALRIGNDGYAPEKLASLTLVVLPIVLAAFVLLDSRSARRGWVAAQLLVGIAVAIATTATGRSSLLLTGRFSLSTVNTISASRLVGVAVVVLLLLATTSRWRAVWALPLAVGCGMVLVQIGSRGPLLFALVSVVAVVLVTKSFAARRLSLLTVAAAAAVAAYVYALADGGSGGQRLVSSLRDGLIDGVRAQLLDDAVRAGAAHPLGVGWGDFLDSSATARAIANSDGVSYAHNAFAEAFSEGGVLALLGFAIVVALAVVRLRRCTDSPLDAVAWGTLVYWLLNAMVSLDLVGNRFMWIALASGLAATTYARESSPEGGDRKTSSGSSGMNRDAVGPISGV